MLVASFISTVSALETMALDFDAPAVKAWFANDNDETYAVNAVSKWALKPEFANDAGIAELTRLMTIATETSLAEKGNTYYTFSNDLWSKFSFWCEEQWETKQDFLAHVSPEGAFGKVWGNFSALTTSQVVFYKDVSPILDLSSRLAELQGEGEPASKNDALPTEYNPELMAAYVAAAKNTVNATDCWYWPEQAGTERCPLQMNMAWTDPRVHIYMTDHHALNIQHVDVVSKWTLKNTTAQAKENWSRLMRKARRLSLKETGCQVYKWGQDAFNENAFWLFEKWASKGDQIAHASTGVFGQEKTEWFAQADGLLAMFSALQVQAN